MLDCLPHKDGSGDTKCFHTDDDGIECGSDSAYAYFISFYVLCSFLVSITIILINFVAHVHAENKSIEIFT